MFVGERERKKSDDIFVDRFSCFPRENSLINFIQMYLKANIFYPFIRQRRNPTNTYLFIFFIFLHKNMSTFPCIDSHMCFRHFIPTFIEAFYRLSYFQNYHSHCVKLHYLHHLLRSPFASYTYIEFPQHLCFTEEDINSQKESKQIPTICTLFQKLNEFFISLY